MIKRNSIILDTETSGGNPEVGCEVIQICAKAINYWDFSDHHAGTFHTYIRPSRPEKAQAGALKILGDGWQKALDIGVEPKVAWTQYYDWCQTVNDGKKVTTKPIAIAYNKDFDQKFIQYHLIEYNIVSQNDFGYDWPWSFFFDAMGVAYMLFESDTNINDLKLDTLLNVLSMGRTNASIHSAIEDVELLTQWYIRCMKFCRECNKRLRVSK